MSKGFKKRMLNVYSNFMRFTVQNTLFNVALILIENIPVLFVIELMYGTDLLSGVFSPLYFLAPSLYLELINEKLPNQCGSILIPNSNSTTSSANTSITNTTNNVTSSNETSEIISNTTFAFFNTTIINLDVSFCVYNLTQFYVCIILVVLVLILFFVLTFLNPRNMTSTKRLVAIVITNFINIIFRPLGVLVYTVLMQMPLLVLYQNQYISDSYYSFVLGSALISVVFLIIFGVINMLFMSYINNAYYFEKFPYDYYSSTDGSQLLILKVLVAFQMNFQKMQDFKNITFVKLFFVLYVMTRASSVITNRNLFINNTLFKNLNTYLSLFFLLYWLLKVLNYSLPGLQDYYNFTLTVEVCLIVIVLLWVRYYLLKPKHEFTFSNIKEFTREVIHFFYFIGNHLNKTHSFNSEKKKTESLIDNIMIGHKMKCDLDECVLCSEEIYDPNLKTLFMVLYGQFLLFEKEIREEDEGICVILRLIFLRFLDDKKIHRIGLIILRNNKVDFSTYLKSYYLYHSLLDELNVDLKNLLTIKYGEVYDELFECIATFEDILSYVKSRTEKVELIINKTNHVGTVFNKLVKDLFFLKEHKRIHFDSINMLQIILVIRLLFHRNVDPELTENLEYNFSDFLENMDKVYEENISFLVRYDFVDNIWRIKKVPKMFVEFTNYRSTDLIDQSLEKIFPNFLAKNIVKKLEESVLSNMNDKNLAFKTFVCDSATNVNFVKFDIEIVPNLERNYILLMNCHFHKRQLLIVDEFGNFINGSSTLYDKMGVSSDIVIKSQGKINMFNVFNLPKTTKLEDVKIVTLSEESLYDTASNVFLIEEGVDINQEINTNKLPAYLEDFVKRKEKLKSEKNTIYMNLFETMQINEVKYFVFKIRITSQEDQRGTLKNIEIQAFKFNSMAGGHAVKRRDSLDSSDGSELKQKKHLAITEEEKSDDEVTDNGESQKKKGNRLSINTPDLINQRKKSNTTNNTNYTPDKDYQKSKNNHQHSGSPTKKSYYNDSQNVNKSPPTGAQNYMDYFNYFYDTQKSASIANDYNKHHMHTIGSQINSVSSSNDVFSFLNIKSTVTKKRSNKFQTFLYCTYIFNFVLVILGLISIIFLNSSAHYVTSFTTTYFSFNKFRNRVYSTTANLLTVVSYRNETDDNLYNSFIHNKLKLTNENFNFDFDKYLKSNMAYHSQKILLEMNNFYNSAFQFFASDFYSSSINFQSNFLYFNGVASYVTRPDYTKNQFGLFSLTANQIATDANTIYLNVSYLTQDMYDNLSLFMSNINIYQYLFNYFAVFCQNLNNINDSFFSFGNDIYDKLHFKAKVLLIVIIILNIAYVVLSFFSILIYRKILLSEFNTLYSINEEHVNRLKEKFKSVKELIKLEHLPSKIYNELRKIKETPSKEENDKKNQQTKNNNKLTNNMTKMNNTSTFGLMRANSVESASSDKTKNSQTEFYLKYSGVKSSLLRSNTQSVQKKIEKIKQESTRAQASIMLLQRLNFEFELIKKFIYFIVLMTLFFLVLGVLTFFLIENKYTAMKMSFNYMNLFLKKNEYFYNYYTSVKLSIMFNKTNPYTINITGDTSNDAIRNKFYNVTDQMHQLQSEYSHLSSFLINDETFEGNEFCSALYANPNDLIDYLKLNSSAVVPELTLLCQAIPILQSNLDTVFTDSVVYIRTVEEKYANGHYKDRVDYLTKDFLLMDIIFGIFAEPYFSYVRNYLLVDNAGMVTNDYNQFIIIMFSINIVIDFLMLWYIWFKIYKKIIDSVNNVHLVTDSVSTI